MAGDLCFAFKRFKPSAQKLRFSEIFSLGTLEAGVDLMLVIFIDVLMEHPSPKEALIYPNKSFISTEVENETDKCLATSRGNCVFCNFNLSVGHFELVRWFAMAHCPIITSSIHL